MTDSRQFLIKAHGVFESLELIPPLAEEFTVYGQADTIEQARTWALHFRYLLVQGLAACAHGLYGMTTCPGHCRDAAGGGLDHSNLWVPDTSEAGGNHAPFLLSHPYLSSVAPNTQIVDETRHYAESHGLRVDSLTEIDSWYGHDSTPIRMSVPDGWPLWPLERMSVLAQYTQPVTWPAD